MEMKQDSEPQRDKHGKLEKNPEKLTFASRFNRTFFMKKRS